MSFVIGQVDPNSLLSFNGVPGTDSVLADPNCEFLESRGTRGSRYDWLEEDGK